MFALGFHLHSKINLWKFYSAGFKYKDEFFDFDGKLIFTETGKFSAEPGEI